MNSQRQGWCPKPYIQTRNHKLGSILIQPYSNRNLYISLNFELIFDPERPCSGPKPYIQKRKQKSGSYFNLKHSNWDLYISMNSGLIPSPQGPGSVRNNTFKLEIINQV
jgi:hypothetical protein